MYFYIFITSSSNKILQVRFVQVRSNLRVLKRKRIQIVALTVRVLKKDKGFVH